MANNFVKKLSVPGPEATARRPTEETGSGKQDAVQRACLELRDLIVRGTIAPGTPLIERTVADVLGVSRTTVRNALQRLANDHFVTVASIGSHYSRFFVGSLTIDEMREWYYMFGALDGIAARGAATLPDTERREVARAGRTLARAHLEAGSGDHPRYNRIQQLDGEFHDTYVQVGGGPLLLREYATLRPHVERYGTFYATALIDRKSVV